MGFQTMEITLQSGRDLNKLNPAKMDVYAVVSISGGDKQEMRTPVDRDGDANPTWDFPMKFKVDDLALQRTLRLTLDFKLVRELPSGDDQAVGELSVWIKELLHSQVMAASDGTKFFTYPVGTRGQLHFSCKFSDENESALMEKLYYGVEIGSAAASSAVEMGTAAALSAVKAGTAAVKAGGAAALSGFEMAKAVGLGAKKKWDEYNGKNKKQDYFAVKAMDIHKKKMEEAAARRKKKEEEEGGFR